ncbi:hypothetical protein ABIA32_005156 [Streptacidiphilus sp. MAP12-20]|uniref:DUF397 domain-containing protein n=1 Tax=Streptacidiphilus sp. MAP12-20 TaxID=3156299 RepID=UPI00351456DD
MITEDNRHGALDWRKSSYSGANACVEVARPGAAVFVRDSKDLSGPSLGFSREAWQSFLAEVGTGSLDRV